MAHYGQHPICGVCDSNAGATDRNIRRGTAGDRAETEGFVAGTREHGHRISRLVGDTYDCGCAGCSAAAPAISRGGRGMGG